MSTSEINRLVAEIDAGKLRKLLHLLEGPSPEPEAITSQVLAEQNDLLSGRLYLRIGVIGGRAFLGELAEERTTNMLTDFQVHVAFRGHRGSTARAPAAVEPQFQSKITFELGELPSSRDEWAFLLERGVCAAPSELADPPPLDSAATLMHLSVTRQMAGHGSPRRELVATASLDWRHALLHDGVFAVELIAAGPDSVLQGTGGILHLRMELQAGGDSEAEIELPFTSRDIEETVEKAAKDAANRTRAFVLYARRWWAEYTNIDPLINQRRTSLFAADEAGGHRSVCSFVSRIRPNRLLHSPQDAARFVSLIPFERAYGVGVRKRHETWHNTCAFLSRRAGDVEDHAVLLCSLLLGFGLDAYVVLGTIRGDRVISAENESPKQQDDQARDHAWVVTFAKTADNVGMKVSFWESLTGQRYVLGSKTRTHPYVSVGCVFNDTSFFGNKQKTDRVGRSNWDLQDEHCWKRMDREMLSALPRPGPGKHLGLQVPTITAAIEENRIEDILRKEIAKWRQDFGLKTTFDNDLSFTFTTALEGYELERKFGVSFGQSDFDDAVRRSVPVGHVFKGYPTCFGHRHAHRMFRSLTEAGLGRDILGTQGDHVRFALRARVVVYPEDLCPTWLMLAVRYLPYSDIES